MRKIKDYLETKTNNKEEFNTNNGWGFGGAYGEKFTLDTGISVRLKVVCYRHMPSDNMVEILYNDETIYNEWYYSKNVPQMIKIIESK